ncbi:MAG TPA: Rrf2 family transcriptional regulator [Polyangiales bacterium]|nr:Rrf2 family transcriptional regulator [Polyangiales bacterium]
MKRDGKLSGVLHVLLHMADAREPITSERLAQAMNTHPVVVRRVMAGLREAGFVRSEKGHGGGWTIACELASTTLLDIYRAVGEPTLVALGFDEERPSCLVARAVNNALSETSREAEELLLRRFGAISLADLAADFSKKKRSHSCGTT